MPGDVEIWKMGAAMAAKNADHIANEASKGNIAADGPVGEAFREQDYETAYREKQVRDLMGGKPESHFSTAELIDIRKTAQANTDKRKEQITAMYWEREKMWREATARYLEAGLRQAREAAEHQLQLRQEESQREQLALKRSEFALRTLQGEPFQDAFARDEVKLLVLWLAVGLVALYLGASQVSAHTDDSEQESMYLGIPWLLRCMLDAPLLLIKFLLNAIFKTDVIPAVRLVFMAGMLLLTFLLPIAIPFVAVIYSPTGLSQLLEFIPKSATAISTVAAGSILPSSSRVGMHWLAKFLWFYLCLSTAVCGLIVGVMGGLLFSAGTREHALVPEGFEQTMIYSTLLLMAVFKLHKGINLLYNAWLVSKVGALMAYNALAPTTAQEQSPTAQTEPAQMRSPTEEASAKNEEKPAEVFSEAKGDGTNGLQKIEGFGTNNKLEEKEHGETGASKDRPESPCRQNEM